MTTEELEYALSQYADGTLPVGERSAVEAAMATDPAAEAVLADYRRLGELLREPPADLDWDRLARRLSAAVADDDRSAVVGRIGWGRRWAAVAAVAAVAVTVGLLARRPGTTSSGPVAAVRNEPGPAVADVSGPALEAGGGPAVADVAVGPSPALAASGSSWRYGEGVVSRPPTVVIAAGDQRFR